MKKYGIIDIASVWATRKKLDGRCEHRKDKGNLPKRSLSGQRYTRELGVTHRIISVLTGKAEDSWQAEIVHRRWLSCQSFLNGRGVC